MYRCNYCTITLIPQVLLKIIQQHLRPIIETKQPDSQAGFQQGRGTCDHIANLRWIIRNQKGIARIARDRPKNCQESDPNEA